MRFIALLIAGALVAMPLAAQPATELASDRRVGQLASQLRCLVCQNQSIAESNAELAVDLRKRIEDQIALGASDGEIIEFMVSRYGDFVLYRPPLQAKTWLLWYGPPLALILSFAGLFRYLRVRRSRLERSELAEEDHARASRLLSGNADDHA